MGDALRLALSTFTVLPVHDGRINRRVAGRAMAAGPVVGALLGLVAAAVLFAARRSYGDTVLATLLSAAIAIAVLALLTRALHLDGLADTADALGCYGSPERALAVLRSPEIGPFGVLAVLFAVLLQVAALATAVRAERGTVSLILAVVAGRLAVVWACTRGVPAARPDGLGALVAGTVRRSVAAVLTLVAGVALAGAAALDDHSGGAGALRAGAALVVALVAAWLLLRHAVRRFGGVTGDVLGALVEVTSTVALLAMAVRG